MEKTFNNQFNICDFGAIGDGKTDCTKAIQTALDKASCCMGEVIVPPGIYKTGELKMGEKTKLSGSSSWNFREFGGSIFELNDPNAKCLIDITGAVGCHICGMSLNGGNIGEDIHGIYLFWPKYNGGEKEDSPTIDDCRVGNFTGDGVHLEHVWCYKIRHSMLCKNKGAGIYIDGWDGFVLDNWLTANKNGGMFSNGIITSHTVTGNRVECNRQGGFITQGAACDNFTGNYFDRNYGPALKLGIIGYKNVRALSVTGNIFFRNGKYKENNDTSIDNSHIVLEGVTSSTIIGNTFVAGQDDGKVGIFTPYYGIYAKNCSYVICKDNVMNNACLGKNIVWEDDKTNLIKDNIGELFVNN